MKSKILLTVFLLLSVPFVALADDSLTENLIPFTAIVTPFVALLLALFFFWLLCPVLVPPMCSSYIVPCYGKYSVMRPVFLQSVSR